MAMSAAASPAMPVPCSGDGSPAPIGMNITTVHRMIHSSDTANAAQKAEVEGLRRNAAVAMLAPASFSFAGRVRGASGRPLRSASRGPINDPPRSSRRVALRGSRL